MTTTNPPRSVLLLGASQRVLDQCLAELRELGFTAQGTTDFFGDLPARFDLSRIGLVSLGGLVPADRKAELRAQIGTINPQAIVIDALAGIPGLIASQVLQAFTPDRQDPARAPAYTPGDRSIRVTLADPAAVTVTAWWRTALIPPDPASDSLVLLDGQLPGGDHEIAVPGDFPPLTATPDGPRPAPWFATVQVGQAIYNLSIPAGQ